MSIKGAIENLKAELKKPNELLIRANACLCNFIAKCPCTNDAKCRDCSEATKLSDEIENYGKETD
jgi:hypothetical protein